MKVWQLWDDDNETMMMRMMVVMDGDVSADGTVVMVVGWRSDRFAVHGMCGPSKKKRSRYIVIT